LADYLINGKKVRIDPSNVLGKGGEADIYRVGNVALKIYKTAQHPDFQGMPSEQQAATERIRLHQKKLKDIPKNLPSELLTPIDLALDSQGKVVGYTMRLLDKGEVLMRYSEKSYRAAGISNDTVNTLFMKLHGAMFKAHNVDFVFGDHNDLNIIITKGDTVNICDVDAGQFGNYLCSMFTNRFVDPLLCGIAGNSMVLQKPHNKESDWYAFCVMLFQSLLYVGPYGGIYKPAKSSDRVAQGIRPSKRITVFNKEVVYPKPATHYKVLPDDLLQHFFKVFEKDFRNGFPQKLIENIRWTKCTACGTEHARPTCPQCQKVSPHLVQQVIQVRGQVTSNQFFRTQGSIVYAAVQNGKLRFLYHKDGQYFREDHNPVASSPFKQGMRFRLCGDATLLGYMGLLSTWGVIPISNGSKYAGTTSDRKSVDMTGNLPIFDANAKRRFWIDGGALYRDGVYGQEYIGNVLKDQTQFWAGDKFGFGFYRAGALNAAFVFDADSGTLNDTVKIPAIKGQLIDSTCVFSDTHVWFFTSTMENGKKLNRCTVIERYGKVVGSAEAEDGDDSWLGTIRGKAAINNFLLAATDEGIVTVSAASGDPVKVKEYPDSEPFVDRESNLFAAIENKQVVIYVVGRHDVKLLKIN
jgi:hypothetical protein